VLMVVVDEGGRVRDISIATSSGVERLDKAALNAVRRWRWSPTIVDGRPSQVRGLVRIPFELKEND
ncbi:energy transducer TonB, partial [Escherichia coli]|uniref:energy transducer TonB n=2 Tax=Pseudomonadota TaxID=1224 RepID=UPI0028589783